MGGAPENVPEALASPSSIETAVTFTAPRCIMNVVSMALSFA
jgi:hypothetical protein